MLDTWIVSGFIKDYNRSGWHIEVKTYFPIKLMLMSIHHTYEVLLCRRNEISNFFLPVKKNPLQIAVLSKTINFISCSVWTEPFSIFFFCKFIYSDDNETPQ